MLYSHLFSQISCAPGWAGLQNRHTHLVAEKMFSDVANEKCHQKNQITILSEGASHRWGQPGLYLSIAQAWIWGGWHVLELALQNMKCSGWHLCNCRTKFWAVERTCSKGYTVIMQKPNWWVFKQSDFWFQQPIILESIIIVANFQNVLSYYFRWKVFTKSMKNIAIVKSAPMSMHFPLYHLHSAILLKPSKCLKAAAADSGVRVCRRKGDSYQSSFFSPSKQASRLCGI